MRNILLLGAGFSKNWGGPLAKEFFEELIADPEIRGGADIKKLLWMYPGNFEEALAELQTAHAKDPKSNAEPLRKLEAAISRLFGLMNDLFAHKPFGK